MSDTTTKTAEYGWLCDYETGNPMRLATEAECSASLIAAILDGGAGIITLDNGQTVFVTGEPTEAHEGYTDKW